MKLNQKILINKQTHPNCPLQKILPKTYPHWVGDGFHVYPVFSGLAFTNELSPFLMLDYGAPK